MSAGYWAVLPSEIRYNPELSSTAKVIYAEITALSGKTGYCFAGNEYFAEQFELSERSVIRIIKELESTGFIRVEGGGNGSTHRQIYAGVNPLRSSDKNVSSPGEVTKMSVGSDKNVSSPIINNKINNNPPIVPQVTQDWKPEIFAAFWKSYPPVNGKRPAKARALKAWNKLKPDDKTIAQMDAALQRDKGSEMWRKGIGIPYASTWLNGRYWEDEVEESAPNLPGSSDSQEVYERW